MSDIKWTPNINKTDGPIYLAITDAIEKDIQNGILKANQALPPQRTLAQLLGIDFTTVSRAYKEAIKRGLIEATTGRGTFVSNQATKKNHIEPKIIDMTMNTPPHFNNPNLQKRIEASMTECVRNQSQNLLLEYQLQGGYIKDRELAAKWLFPRLPNANIEQLLICPGAQTALFVILQLLLNKHDTICCEELTYPGFLSIANHMELKLAPIEMDDEGIIPQAFETACKKQNPKALYCTPTLHNPTTVTWSLQRRQQIIEIAKKYNIPIIEDDAYGILSLDPTPSLSSLAPELVYYIASTAKYLGPALRIAYLHTPNRIAFLSALHTLRATSRMASPLMSNLVSYWIDSGIANEIVQAIRIETKERISIASNALSEFTFLMSDYAFHMWLQLPPALKRGDVINKLQQMNITALPSDAFSAGKTSEAIRLSLGAIKCRETLGSTLEIIRDILKQSPKISSIAV